MDNQIVVSALILSYNSSETLAQTLDSVIRQSCNFPFEVIVGDDCSKDTSRDICLQFQKQYPDKVRLVFNKSNLGIVGNWLNLVKEAKGKYITSCAGDDYWHNPSKLQLQVDYLESRPDYAVVYTNVDILNTVNGRVIRNYLQASGKKCYEGAGLTEDIYKGRVPIKAVSVCFRKDAFVKYIPTEDYIRFKFPIEDWPTWLILSNYYKIGYIPVSTATYRKGHESISNPLEYEKVEKRFEAEKVMYKYVSHMFPGDIMYDETTYNNYINEVLLNLAFKKSDFNSAKKFAGRLLKNNFTSRKVRMARNWLVFKIFTLIKKIRK